jgi:sirohydrochlorin ferrochelatase
MTGYIVFAHGSSIESANQAVRIVAEQMAMNGDLSNVIAAFLEGGQPGLQTAVGILAERGIERIIVVPYFLTLGLHLQRDLPRIAEEARVKYPRVELAITAPLDGHPAMADALLDRALSISEPACKQP